jgi:glycosyltransferase involved in cell wall biosynthesis
MNIIHLTASTFFGGPERQMLGLARHLPEGVRSVFLSFSEGGRCRAFLSQVRQHGFEGIALHADTPRLFSAMREVAARLGDLEADVLLCHGYKANLLGRPAARRVGIPAVAVARGWTGECLRVRLYERLDRFHLRFMDRVVAVSEAQAQKVRRAGVRAGRLRVIANAIDPDRFLDPDPRYRARLERYFRPARERIVGAAGRLSPEKGFDVLIEAAARVVETEPDVGFVLFGEGPQRAELARLIAQRGLTGTVVLAGFRNDLDRFLPHLDLLVLPSRTEGLPNVILEACAAGVPVVATAVGGTPEVLQDGVSGFLVPPDDPAALASGIVDAFTSEERLREFAFQGRQQVLEGFAFGTQAQAYLNLLDSLCPGSSPPEPALAPAESHTEGPIPAEPTCER